MIVKKGIIALAILACIAAIFTMPVMAAVPVSNTNYSGDNGGYVIKPANSAGAFGILTISGSVTQGQTNWHYKTVSGYMTTLNVDLSWGNPSNSLQLTIYSPDNHVFGPYYDRDDGAVDGKINLDIYNANGIATGTWTYKVYGYSVSGAQSYTI